MKILNCIRELRASIIVFFISIFIFSGFAGNYVFAQTYSNCTISNTLLIQTNAETTLLGLINTYRQQNSLPALAWSSGLKRPAAWLSNDMFTKDYFSHTDSLGRIPDIRIKECGYDWKSFAENIYMGSNDPQTVFNAWKNSPTHNTNMLNPNVKEAGIGFVSSYWTLDLGSTSSTTPTTPTTPVTTTNPTILPTTTPTGIPQLSSTPAPTLTPSPTPTPSIIINPTDTQLEISIKLPGIGATGNKTPKHLTRLVQIGIFDQDNKQVLKGSGYLKYDGRNFFSGVIHLGQLAPDTYLLKVSSTNTLVTLIIPQFQYLTSEKVNVLPLVLLTAGDFNNDNSIDIRDYSLTLPCFQNLNCQSKADVDINDDGKINILDYSLFLSDFRQHVGD